MATSKAISRFTDYYRRHGFASTLRRAAVAAKRSLFSNRSVLFYCDLATQLVPPQDLPSSLTVELIKCPAELSFDDFEAMTSFWNPKLVERNVKERFEKQALLWLIKSEGKLAGYGWTLRGRTVEPHFFLLGPDDVHLFDFHVFPQYRGRGINPTLVTHILRRLAVAKVGRAFIEAAEWNQPQLSSLTKTPFRRIGMATKWTIWGHTVVLWGK